MNDDERADYLWGKRHEVIYRAELSALYHQKRERFFELFDKLTKAASLIGGSAALWKIGNPKMIAAAAVLITSSSALSLVLSFSERSKRHAELSRNFRQLLAEIENAGETGFTEVQVCEWASAARRIEATEPPALGLLVVICQNELSVAQGQPEKVVKVGWFKRMAANFIDLDVSSHVTTPA